MFVCECVFECVCVCDCVCVCVCVCVCLCVHMVNVKDLPCGVIPGMKLTELIRALPAWRGGERMKKNPTSRRVVSNRTNKCCFGSASEREMRA
jgi:hypothetical protein